LSAAKDLSVDFRGGGGNVVHAVKNVSFDIGKAETVALVGESGSGKNGDRALHPSPPPLSPPPLIPQGVIRFKGEDLMALPLDGLRHVRGNQISMIFQEPMTSLNPLHTIEQQIGEVLKIHRGLSNSARRLACSISSTRSASRIRKAASTPTRISSQAVSGNG
jgi:microcin C transport system ATP-binding protein